MRQVTLVQSIAKSGNRQCPPRCSTSPVLVVHGTWFATTEPTMPPFCTCIHNDVQIHELEGWYAYTSHATCEGKIPISVPVKGELSKDPSSPGLLHENFGLFNHTMSSLDPNMIFEAQYNERGEMVLAMTYACLGWLLPVPPIGEPKFSFNVPCSLSRYPFNVFVIWASLIPIFFELDIAPLVKPTPEVLSRRRNWTTSDLREVVANATKATQGLLDVANVRFADQQTYASCASDITV